MGSNTEVDVDARGGVGETEEGVVVGAVDHVATLVPTCAVATEDNRLGLNGDKVPG